jgi:hypothetical protein
MTSSPFWIPRFTPLLFLLPGLGLLFQAATSATATSAERLLSLAIALFCPELARMAQVDLDNIAAILERNAQAILEQHAQRQNLEPVAQQADLSPPEDSLPEDSLSEDSRLHHFYKVTISTIALEIVGFYLSLLSLQWGALTLIFSQIWFNLLAGVQLSPKETPAITPLGIAERQAVLAANAIGFGLLCCWSIKAVQVWLALGLLVLVALFLVIKYGVLGLRSGSVR